jgi:formylglycine-generating enzyme required for sulfatase activity
VNAAFRHSGGIGWENRRGADVIVDVHLVPFFSTCTNFTGAVGNNVATGTTKQIFRGARYDTLPTNNYPHTRVRVSASDSMALIPAGAFQMGTNVSDDQTVAGPNHTVTLSAFFMDKHAVTSQQWFEVRNGAMTNGDAFGAVSGKAANHPVQRVSWYDCVKWCNARSQMEGRTPCYYTNAAQTLVYRGGSANLSNDMTPDYSYSSLEFRCVRGQ